MQSLQPEPAARYKNVMDALHRIVATEGVWRPMRGLNATAVGAGPAHALYFACYEKLKKTLSDVIHPGANSHLANGTTKHAYAHITQLHAQMGGRVAVILINPYVGPAPQSSTVTWTGSVSEAADSA